MSGSKQLSHDDESGFEFAKEMLDGNDTAAINFDRIQHHPVKGYIIFEYLRCKESQEKVTPHSSHPRFYWDQNSQKFLKLWKITQDLNAKLYLVNYAKSGTPHDNEVLLFDVEEINEELEEKVKAELTPMDRSGFKKFFRTLNTECLGLPPCPVCGSPLVERNGQYGPFMGCSEYRKTQCKGR